MEWFSKANRGATVFGTWFTVITAVGAGYGWLASKAPWLSGLNWAEYLFLGIGGSLATFLVIALGLALVGLNKSRQPSEPAMTQSSATGLMEVGAFDPRLPELRSEVRSLEKRISDLSEKLPAQTQALRGDVEELNRILRDESQGHAERLVAIEATAAQVGPLSERLAFLIADLDKRFAGVDHAFDIMAFAGTLGPIEQQIEERALELEAMSETTFIPQRMPDAPREITWRVKFHEWEELVIAFVRQANHHQIYLEILNPTEAEREAVKVTSYPGAVNEGERELYRTFLVMRKSVKQALFAVRSGAYATKPTTALREKEAKEKLGGEIGSR